MFPMKSLNADCPVCKNGDAQEIVKLKNLNECPGVFLLHCDTCKGHFQIVFESNWQESEGKGRFKGTAFLNALTATEVKSFKDDGLIPR